MYRHEKSKFNILLDNVEVVSFDVFDTLLLRPYAQPEDVFEHMEKYYNLPGFKEERVLAEKRARYLQKVSEDITIDEIYNNISTEFASLKNLEIEFEKQILFANPYILDFYNRAVALKKRIVAISDMYLPSEFLREVLIKNGFDKIEKVFVSCEYGKSKGTKHLFSRVQKELGGVGENFLHIGDNIQSDYLSPVKFGWKALYLEKSVDRFSKTVVGKKYKKFYNSDKKLLEGVLFSLRASFTGQSKQGYWYDLAYNFGGIFAIGYVRFVIEQCRKNNIDNLFFVSRDGYILQKVYNILAGNSVVENHYIYAPRILNLRCFLDYRHNLEYLKNIFELNKDLCSDFEKCPETLKEAEKLYKRNLAKISLRASFYKEEYEKYLTSLNIQNERIATVDMTTGAFTSQSFLKKFFGDKLLFGIFSGTFNEVSEMPYKRFITKKFIKKDLAKLNILELLFTAPELPLECIRDGQPVFKTRTSADEFRLKIFSEIERGILDFVSEYKKIFGKFSLDIQGDDVFDFLNLVTVNPSKEDRCHLTAVSHSKDVNNKHFRPIYSDLKFLFVLKNDIKDFLALGKKQIRYFLIEKRRLARYHFYDFCMIRFWGIIKFLNSLNFGK